tara:strand:- start:21762 stop:22499 length:738 start_codon:yes stop_codon:yes gene_type:complete
MSIAGLGLLMLVPACATAPEAPPHPAGPQVFVSPFGEPFTSGPSEPYPVTAWFTGADSDHNDILTPTEFTVDGDRWFLRLDRDGDQVLSLGEIMQYEQEVTLALQGGRRPGGADRRNPERSGSLPPVHGLALAGDQERPQRGGGGRQGGQRGQGRRDGGDGGGAVSRLAMAGLLNVPQPVKSADTNFDQKVTRDEWHATADRWFRLLDSDHDGRLLMSELPETALQRGEGRGPGRGQGQGRRGPD